MTSFPDPRETRPAAAREAELFSRLSAQISHAQRATTAFAQSMATIDGSAVTSRAALAKLPVIRKDYLLQIKTDNQN